MKSNFDIYDTINAKIKCYHKLPLILNIEGKLKQVILQEYDHCIDWPRKAISVVAKLVELIYLHSYHC